jgi:hypothetical protein
MGNWRALTVIVTLSFALVAGTATVHAQDPDKGKREKALADLDKLVEGLKPIVDHVEKMSPCAGSPPAAPPAKPGRPTLPSRRPPTPAPAPPAAPPAGGKQFCPSAYDKAYEKMLPMIDEAEKWNTGNPRDDRTGHVKMKWTTYRVSFKTALEQLAQMKKLHKTPLAHEKVCQTEDEKLEALARAAIANKSLDEFEAARYEAEKSETTVDNLVVQGESNQSTIMQLYSQVLLFNPDNKKWDKAWKPVTKALHASAKKMLDEYREYWAKAFKVCALPAEGDDSPELRKLEDELFGKMRKDLDTELQAWIDDTKKNVLAFDCESMKKLYKSFCEEWDADDDDQELPKYWAEADQLEEDMKKRLSDPEIRLDQLSTRALQLQARRNGRMGTIEAYKKWVADIDVFRDQLKQQRDKLDRMKYAGIFQGSNNPKIQLWKSFGVKMHDAMEDKPEYGCTMKDQSFCDQWEDADKTKCIHYRRPDCVNVPACRIYEFKPPGAAAVKKGEQQLIDYKKMLDDHYNEMLAKKDKGESINPVGGSGMFEDIIKACTPDGGKISWKIYAGVKKYEKCEAELEYKCE